MSSLASPSQAVPPIRQETGVPAARERSRILIGPLSSDPTESVSCVNAAFIEGLENRHEFLALDATRTHGKTRQSMLNVINLFYFARQFSRWFAHLALRRPQLAHYAISSGWAMEKGLVLMKLARVFGAKTLGHLHSGEFIDHWEALPSWRKKLALREFLRLDGIVLTSQWWCEPIRELIPLPADRFFVVNNPIDAEFEEAALRMPIERETTTVLSLGTMGRDKGIMEALEGAQIAREHLRFRLELAGPERDPNIRQRVRQYIEQHSLFDTVNVTAGVRGEEKIRLFSEASIFLLPSYYENFPLVLIEAAAAGMAIVTTPVGAVPEFFKDGVSALFVEPRNAQQIADALLRLIQHPKERVRIGQAAREMFRTRLTRDRIMKSMDEAYCLVLV